MRYFAAVREALGPGGDVELAGGADIAALRDHLAARDPAHRDALGRQRVLRSARNRVLCAESVALGDGDEVGFFPPVTGG